jgi:hypothetical protein
MFATAMRCRRMAFFAMLCLLAIEHPARSAELADFHAAVERAAEEYRSTMITLETQGQQETSAAVLRFRRAWQAINEQFGKDRPAAFADDEEYGAMFMLVDAQLVGALLIIDMGNRNAARKALAPIEATLSQLSERSLPR